MDLLPSLLAWVVLLPLLSFALILVFGPWMGKGGSAAGSVAALAIVGSFALSLTSAVIWFSHHPPRSVTHHSDAATGHGEDHADHSSASEHDPDDGASREAESDHESEPSAAHGGGHAQPLAGQWYTLGTFGPSQSLKLTIGYYIDSLTVCMCCMVSLIAALIHFYSMGYMHEELHDVTDHEVTVSDGSHLHRRGRYHRFFQFLSLFSFSMLGLVVSGNIAMTFVFWELVGICSYFLIGFYVERHSASTAANKAFIVNRVGDFGMIIGLMALWSSLGTFAFGDIDGEPGIFSQVRSPENNYELATPDGMVKLAATAEIGQLVAELPETATAEQIQSSIAAAIPEWRASEGSEHRGGVGYWLLIVAGVGIFCGCVGKSAQFPLHVWLPDAMEGPTPVSALVHSATMVAAGVFLVTRFYPVFTPEVLLVIAVVGTITLFMAATIAITATDIKRVLAYSTVSQLGYMMMALGVGGWLAGVMHLITHAFFKSLLFLCSGSVIHAVHTNEMTQMGGLRKKMPITAYTMLVGCLAIAGAGIPFLIGFSGYYSKDAILEQALSFRVVNPGWGPVFFFAAAGGAAITAFYMFRLWYMTFAGEPRDRHRYDHAHESPPVMYVPLIVLAVFAISVAWQPNDAMLGAAIALVIIAAVRLVLWLRGRSEPSRISNLPFVLCGIVLAVGVVWWFFPSLRAVTLANMLEQSRPLGTEVSEAGALVDMTWPAEHESHASAIRVPATWIAFSTALAGFLLATVFYGWRLLDPDDARRQFRPLYSFLLNKWWFDELYDFIFVRPTHFVAGLAAAFDRRWIDGAVDGAAWCVRRFAILWDLIADRTIVDGFVNAFARWSYALGLSMRGIQTGRLRSYVLFIVVGTLAVFVLASFLLSGAFAS
jgi:NADH:ubiquinone oxidoreductase subunit 5 (subunit L)/multisubunit Na+/H+ antiporter MnhA subunit